MIKLLRFLKPFIFPLIISIILLFIQAQTELTLPDYMSKIVNIGIQQNGITGVIPKVLTKQNLNDISIFLSKEEETLLLKNFELIKIDNPKYKIVLNEFPKISGDIYLPKNNLKTSGELEEILSRGIFSYSMLEFYSQKNPDIFLQLKNMSPEEKSDLISKLNSKPLDYNAKKSIVIKSISKLYASFGKDMRVNQNSFIMSVGGKMLLIALLGAICAISVAFISSKVAAKLAMNLRRDIFTKIENFSNNEFDKFSTNTLITRSTNDINQIQNLLVVMIRMLFFAPIIGIGGIVKALGRSHSMSYIIIICVIILIGIVSILFSITLPKFKIIQEKLDKINLILRENLQGLHVIRAFNNEKFEEKRFDNTNNELTKLNIFVNQTMVILHPAMSLIMNRAMIAITWFGAHEIAKSNMQIGDMMAFMQYAVQIIFSFLMLSFMFIMVPRATISANRIAEVLETDLSILDPEISKEPIEKTKGIIEFKNVSFRYNGAQEKALKNINFIAESGQTTAIIGSTGSGKSTLTNLIPRFYDATEGEILINSTNIKDISQNELRSLISFAPQKSSLFTGTIKSNMLYANENASEDDILKALEISRSTEFVLEKGIDSEVSQEGTNFSGGQKQRLSIARALIKESPIYIFDDSFSALDFKTDFRLRQSLKRELKNKTIIIVAQRISTIKTADKILVLDDGNLVGIGTHKELMESCETYKEIAFSQLSKEELA